MRLQGWPDTHCDFKMELELDGNRWKPTGKAVKQAEGPKYKQAGNGVTANVVAYIAGKLMDALSK
jgi:site-specific DNA-cytosine methylase